MYNTSLRHCVKVSLNGANCLKMIEYKSMRVLYLLLRLFTFQGLDSLGLEKRNYEIEAGAIKCVESSNDVNPCICVAV